jgi:hypothetical protein
MTELDPTVYERAADYIDEHGHWTAGSASIPRVQAVCISNAIVSPNCAVYQKHLIEHLGLNTLTDVFELNDRMDKAWATSVLREIAEKIRANQ